MKNMNYSTGSLLLCLLLFSACKSKPKLKTSPDTINVHAVQLSMNSSENTDLIQYNGTLEADKTIDLSFQVSGTITSMPIQTGDYVQKGQLIATIDETIYRNQYNVQLAQARLAGENYTRLYEVYKKGSVAEIKMLEAKSNFEQATSAAQATYQNIVHTKLYAPQNGYIGSKKGEAGATASPGMPVIQLLDIRSVQVLVAVPESEINQYHPGDEASVTIESFDNRPMTGHISEIGVLAQANSASYNVKVNLSNPGKQLKPGMLCKVSFKPVSRLANSNEKISQKIVVPPQAVQIDEKGRSFVYVTDADGKRAIKKDVKTGALYNSGIALNSGLAGNEQLITSGFQKLGNNIPVKIIK